MDQMYNRGSPDPRKDGWRWSMETEKYYEKNDDGSSVYQDLLRIETNMKSYDAACS